MPDRARAYLDEDRQADARLVLECLLRLDPDHAAARRLPARTR